MGFGGNWWLHPILDGWDYPFFMGEDTEEDWREWNLCWLSLNHLLVFQREFQQRIAAAQFQFGADVFAVAFDGARADE